MSTDNLIFAFAFLLSATLAKDPVDSGVGEDKETFARSGNIIMKSSKLIPIVEPYMVERYFHFLFAPANESMPFFLRYKNDEIVANASEITMSMWKKYGFIKSGLNSCVSTVTPSIDPTMKAMQPMCGINP
jgi:hypothetical protein